MIDTSIIEKKAQIKILSFLLDHLCNSELSGIGRIAVNRLIKKLTNEINETTNAEG